MTKKLATKKPVVKKMATKSKKTSSAKSKTLLKPKPKSAKSKKPPVKASATKSKKLQGIPEQLRAAALKVLDERQADDIADFDMTGRSSIADYIIVASGRAARQIGAIAHYLREAFEKLGAKYVHIEGQGQGDWVLVDGGDIIVHLFKPEVRAYYKIEEIWQRKPAG